VSCCCWYYFKFCLCLLAASSSFGWIGAEGGVADIWKNETFGVQFLFCKKRRKKIPQKERENKWEKKRQKINW
jgi:hypothetical protein